MSFEVRRTAVILACAVACGRPAATALREPTAPLARLFSRTRPLKRWLLVVLAACGGGPAVKPVVLDAVKCTAKRDAVERDVAAGELIRAQRRLAIEASRCATDPWIDETKTKLARALESNESGDALLAKDTNADRDRALIAFERRHQAGATVEAAAFAHEADEAPKYSPSGGYVVLGSYVVDAHAGRVVTRVEIGDEIVFSPDDAKVGIASNESLRVVALPGGEEIVRHGFGTSFASWSQDGAWLAWSGEHAGWAEMATKRVHLLGGSAPFRGTPAVGRGVVAAPTDAGGLVVKRLSNDELVATFAKADSFAIDRSADRMLFLEESKGPLRELDLATGKTRKLPWKSPRYGGMCGEDATWGLVSVDRDQVNLTRDCSGVDRAVLDMKTGRATFRTIADGEDLVSPEEAWGHDDKSAWQDVLDVDFTTYSSVLRAPKRETFAGFDRSGRARVWTKDGKVVWAGPARPEQIVALALAPDGSELVSFSHANALRRWNVRTGALVSTRSFTRDACTFRDLAMRDDGEAVIACAAGEDTDRFYRERATAPVLERKRRDGGEKATLDRRGAFAVFTTWSKPPIVIALEPNAKPVERPLPDPKLSLAAVAGDFIVLASGTGDRALHRWSTGALLASIPSGAPNHFRTWVGFANRGTWLAAERSTSLDLWTIGETAKQAVSLSKSPGSPASVAIASPHGPFAVRSSIELATWSSPDDEKPAVMPIHGDAKTVEWDAPRSAFVFANATGVTFRSTARERSLDLYAVPFSDAFAAIDGVTHTVTRGGGDRKLAGDLLACHIGTRTLPYAVCAGRFDAL